MLDVEIVVLDIRKHGAGEAELALESRAGVAVEQFGIFGRDALALGGDGGRRAVDLLAGLNLNDVVPDIAERNVEVLDPIFVVGIEAVAAGEVEPRVLRLLPRLQPVGAARLARDRGQRLIDRAVLQRLGDADLHRELGELLQLVVGAEQVDLDALHHLRDSLIGDRRELALQESEEIEIGGVAEVEELEVILPGLVE